MKSVRGVTLADNEVVIREYEASNLEEIKGKGYVIATNRRLIYTGSAKTALGKSVLVRDTKIDSITGVSGGLSHKKSLIQLIIGAIIAIIGLVTIFNDSMIMGIAILAVGLFIAYRGLKSNGVQMYVSIMSSQASPAINVSVEASKGFFSRITSHDAFLTVYASGPGSHTEQLIREIGALIQDIQTMGDLAVDKWKNLTLEGTAIQTQSPMNQLTSTFRTVKESVATTVSTVGEVKTQKVETTEAPAYKNCSCGSKLQQDAVFCGECGKKFEDNIFG